MSWGPGPQTPEAPASSASTWPPLMARVPPTPEPMTSRPPGPMTVLPLPDRVPASSTAEPVTVRVPAPERVPP